MKSIKSLVLLGILLVSQSLYSQADCNCANDPKVLQYKNKVMSGENVQVCSFCADIAFWLCLCNCPTTAVPREQIEKAIDYDRQTMIQLRDQGVGICCDFFNAMGDCPNAGIKKGEAAGDENGIMQGPSQVAQDNQQLLDFANMLAPYANNAEAKQMVKDLNNIHNVTQVAKDIFSAGGAGAKTTQFLDNAERVGQGVAIAKAWMTPSEEQLQNEAKLQAEQAKSQQFIDLLNSEIWQFHVKTLAFPSQNARNPSMEALNSLEQQIKHYDQNTAMQRLLILKFQHSKEIPEVRTLNYWASQIKTDFDSYGLGHIQAEINKYNEQEKIGSYLLNTDQSMKTVVAEFNLLKAKQQGDQELITKISGQLNEYNALKSRFDESTLIAKKSRKAGIIFVCIPLTPCTIIGISKFVKAKRNRAVANEARLNSIAFKF